MKTSASQAPSTSVILSFVLKTLWLKVVEPIVRFLELKVSGGLQFLIGQEFIHSSKSRYQKLHHVSTGARLGHFHSFQYMLPACTMILKVPQRSCITPSHPIFRPSAPSSARETRNQVPVRQLIMPIFKMLVIVQPKCLPYTLHELRTIQRHIPSQASPRRSWVPSFDTSGLCFRGTPSPYHRIHRPLRMSRQTELGKPFGECVVFGQWQKRKAQCCAYYAARHAQRKASISLRMRYGDGGEGDTR